MALPGYLAIFKIVVHLIKALLEYNPNGTAHDTNDTVIKG